MPDHTVTPLRPRAAAGYTDTAALNDIHALITSQVPADTTVADIAQILARTGRPAVAVRDIEITATETAHGRPVACARSGGTSVMIRQEPAGPGLLIEITSTPADRDTLTVTLDGSTLHPARPRGTP